MADKHEWDKYDDEWLECPDEESPFAEVPFYEEGYLKRLRITPIVDINNPCNIYQFLKSHIYKQEQYCRDAAMILYNHVRGITSRNFVCGPAGCGKTHLWERLKEIYSNIIIVDSSNITKDGWNGNNKVHNFLSQVDPFDPDYIIVFDEFDKLAAPKYSYNENVSACIQSELLKLVEGEIIHSKRGQSDISIDTSLMSFIFCGSFAQKAEEIAEKHCTTGIGFGAFQKNVKAFDEELTLQDIIDFGVIPELASRSTRITNLRPLTLDDYISLLSKHPNSPVKRLEELYGITINLSDAKCREIAQKSYQSGLGVRNATAQIQQIVDEQIFNNFEKNHSCTNIVVC